MRKKDCQIISIFIEGKQEKLVSGIARKQIVSKAYGYARVSSKEQHLDRQIIRLQEYVEKDGRLLYIQNC